MDFVKNLYALLVIGLILLFALFGVGHIFATTDATGILFTLGVIALFFLILIVGVRFYYRDDIRKRKQAEAEQRRKSSGQ